MNQVSRLMFERLAGSNIKIKGGKRKTMVVEGHGREKRLNSIAFHLNSEAGLKW